jgi:hypothetical protein
MSRIVLTLSIVSYLLTKQLDDLIAMLMHLNLVKQGLKSEIKSRFLHNQCFQGGRSELIR